MNHTRRTASFASLLRATVFAAFCAVVVVGAAACSDPLPADKSDYAGEWTGRSMSLVITPEGMVHYRRFEGGINKEINAPLQEFVDGGFLVGVSFASTKFVVQQPPGHVDGRWRMTVDGVELVRAQ